MSIAAALAEALLLRNSEIRQEGGGGCSERRRTRPDNSHQGQGGRARSTSPSATRTCPLHEVKELHRIVVHVDAPSLDVPALRCE